MIPGATIRRSFAISPLITVTTLARIIIHEISHGISDFAILLQSGFDHQQATKAQFLTDLGGITGVSQILEFNIQIKTNTIEELSDYNELNKI